MELVIVAIVATYVMFTQDIKTQLMFSIINIFLPNNKTACQSCMCYKDRGYFKCHSYVKKLIDHSFCVKMIPQFILRQSSICHNHSSKCHVAN